MTLLAVIPARGGSRTISRKNLAWVAGRPLLAWTIDAARHAKTVNRVVVSSDDDEILSLAKELGAEPLRRPGVLATDLARSEAAVTHALETLDHKSDAVVLLQPTSPLRRANHIDEAVALLTAEVSAVISVFEPAKSPFKSFFAAEDGTLRPVAADQEAPFRPRQSLPRTYYPNGAIYLVRTAAFLAVPTLIPAGTRPYVMSEEASLDLDSAADFAKAESLLACSTEGPVKWRQNCSR